MKQEYLNMTYISTITVLILIVLYLATKESDDCIIKGYTIPFHTKRKINFNNGILYDVPLSIYQSWHSNNVPPKMKEAVYEVIENNPEFDHYLYSDEACSNFIEENFDEEVMDAFHLLKPGAYKSDLWRYCILYKIGGVYLDIKFLTIKPLLKIIKNDPIVFVKDVPNSCENSLFRTGIYNAFMISPPNNLVFKYCIEEIVKNCKFRLYKSNTLHVTGPCLLREIVEKYAPNYNYPYENFPLMDDSRAIIGNEKEAICVSYIEYRDEQKFAQKSPHYSLLWELRDIYN